MSLSISQLSQTRGIVSLHGRFDSQCEDVFSVRIDFTPIVAVAVYFISEFKPELYQFLRFTHSHFFSSRPFEFFSGRLKSRIFKAL